MNNTDNIYNNNIIINGINSININNINNNIIINGINNINFKI